MGSQECALLCLRVQAEADPGVIARVLERFQNLNIVPRRITAESAVNGQLHIQVDVFGISESMLSLITSKLGQVPSILNARWHRP